MNVFLCDLLFGAIWWKLNSNQLPGLFEEFDRDSLFVCHLIFYRSISLQFSIIRTHTQQSIVNHNYSTRWPSDDVPNVKSLKMFCEILHSFMHVFICKEFCCWHRHYCDSQVAKRILTLSLCERDCNNFSWDAIHVKIKLLSRCIKLKRWLKTIVRYWFGFAAKRYCCCTIIHICSFCMLSRMMTWQIGSHNKMIDNPVAYQTL